MILSFLVKSASVFIFSLLFGTGFRTAWLVVDNVLIIKQSNVINPVLGIYRNVNN